MPSHPDRVRRHYVDVDDRLFKCPSCPFEGGEDAMIQHAMDCGHVAVPETHDEELSRMMG